jgi:hypothetical protein
MYRCDDYLYEAEGKGRWANARVAEKKARRHQEKVEVKLSPSQAQYVVLSMIQSFSTSVLDERRKRHGVRATRRPAVQQEPNISINVENLSEVIDNQLLM